MYTLATDAGRQKPILIVERFMGFRPGLRADDPNALHTLEWSI